MLLAVARIAAGPNQGRAEKMSEYATLERNVPAAASEDDSAKRRQIIEGARAVFLARGFDAASMNDIARAAAVSKGTLYVYFENKEQLFEAIVEQECDAQAEGIFNFDSNDRDAETALTRMGVAYVKFLCRPEKASAIRTVIAIADRMPEVGRRFYEAGPARGIAKLAEYISALGCTSIRRMLTSGRPAVTEVTSRFRHHLKKVLISVIG